METLFSVVGFIFLVILLGLLSFGWLLMAWDGLGRWNIGGAHNSWLRRLVILFWGSVLGSLWYFLFTHMPFTITLTTGG